jgi:hypothetical protein
MKNNQGLSTLNNCFQAVIKVTNTLRRENKSFDGLGFWEKKLKPLVSQITEFSYIANTTDLSKEYALITQKVPSKTDTLVSDFSLEEFKDGKINEPYHFYLQQFRLPLYKEKTFMRLMQTAYNVGQLSTVLDKLPAPIAERYAESNLTKMKIYVDSATEISDETCKKIQEISEQIAKLT